MNELERREGMIRGWTIFEKKNLLHVVLLLTVARLRLQVCEKVAGLGWRK